MLAQSTRENSHEVDKILESKIAFSLSLFFQWYECPQVVSAVQLTAMNQSRSIDFRPVERTTRRTVAVLLTFISLGVLSGPLASTSGAASTSGSLTFAGSLSGTVN